MRSLIAAAIGVAVGIWMMTAPAVLGYSGSAAANDRIVGPTAAAVAWVAATQVTRSIRWVNVVLGGWMLVSSLFLGYPGAATVHVVLSGTAIVASALAIPPLPRDRYDGGWKGLLERG